MADQPTFAGLLVNPSKPNESTDVVKPVDTTPAPDRPLPPKPPAGWDKISYHMARAMRRVSK